MPHTARQCGPLRTLTRIATKHVFRLTLTVFLQSSHTRFTIAVTPKHRRSEPSPLHRLAQRRRCHIQQAWMPSTPKGCGVPVSKRGSIGRASEFITTTPYLASTGRV
jgi:hypothetical protein